MSENLEIRIEDKREGETSFSSLYPVKRERKGKKVGHAGTLDKFASGLMIVLVGNATKLNPVFSSFSKSYRATLCFGKETDTLDPEGNVVARSGVPSLSDIERTIPLFIGKQMQRPPLYSALHVNGRRAYEIARSGENVDMKEREIEIYSISLLSYDPPYLVLDLEVSKGTYIRSFARDFASSMGVSAYLSALRRLTIGPYDLGDVGKDTMSLLEKSGLFSILTLDGKYRKLIENGTLERSFVTSDTDEGKRYKIACLEGEPFQIIYDDGRKLKGIARF